MVTALWLTACLGPGRTLMEVPVSMVSAGEASWTLDDGATIVLDEAAVSFHDLRLSAPPETLAWQWSLIPTAYAHPGHDPAGLTEGELLGTFEVDLLAGVTELGMAQVYDGVYATGRLDLGPGVVSFGGTYTPAGGAARAFRFEELVDRSVTQIPFEHTLEVGVAGTVWVSVDPASVLGAIDWRTPAAGPVLQVSDGLIVNTFPFGVASTRSWSLRWTEP